jgi:hypothetical protein
MNYSKYLKYKTKYHNLKTAFMQVGSGKPTIILIQKDDIETFIDLGLNGLL